MSPLQNKEEQTTVHEIAQKQAELKKNVTTLFQEWILPYVKMSRGEGLSIAQMFILRYLTTDKPKDLTSMSEFLGVSKPTVTGIMNTLEKDGFITRRRDRNDRRRIETAFTQRALEVFERFETFSDFLINGLIQSLPADLLSKLNENILSLTEKLSEMYSRETTKKGEF